MILKIDKELVEILNDILSLPDFVKSTGVTVEITEMTEDDCKQLFDVLSPYLLEKNEIKFSVIHVTDISNRWFYLIQHVVCATLSNVPRTYIENFKEALINIQGYEKSKSIN